MGEPSELVGVSEIAELAGVSVYTVYAWRRRHQDFPAPVAELTGLLVWRWPEVQAWLRATGRWDQDAEGD